MLYKKGMLLIGLCFILLLSACSGESTREMIYEHLEEAVKLEDNFAKQQEDINQLEQQEQELYAQIIDLQMNEMDKIKELSQQAIGIIEERKEKMNLEKESIDASKEEFTKIENLIEELDEEALKEKAQEMYDVMNNRYQTYDQLHQAYMNSLELEKELYELLQDENVTQEQLSTHIENINKTYEEVISKNDQFNAETVAYNDLKKEFYEMAELDVTY